MEDILALILRDNFTPTSCIRRLHLLENLISKKIFQKDQPAKSSVLSLLPQEDSDWVKTISPDLLKNITERNFEQIFRQAEEQIKQIQPLVIFVPFIFANDQILEIGLYLRRNYGEKFLFETKIDPNLVAGAALSWKGNYKDYSLRKKMDDQQQLVLSTLKQYIKH